ncbi:MAG: ribonuclease PH [Deltaproteobacteria bacterium]|nr:ribonuclease PH [Deltaproteobacteria bacterium]
MPRVTLRSDGRKPEEMRHVLLTRNYLKTTPGSCLIEVGATKVVCAANIEERVPPHLKNTGTGWITAEYSMLPASTSPRSVREASRGRVGGRTHEIQRLIGRALRAAMDLQALGERTILLDCDVIQADGGTRTASITGAYVALYDAVSWMLKNDMIARNPIHDQVAAISVGIVEEDLLLDLNYEEDSKADVDMNVVMTGKDYIIEVQCTAEGRPFSKGQMQELIEIAQQGIQILIKKQIAVLGLR